VFACGPMSRWFHPSGTIDPSDCVRLRLDVEMVPPKRNDRPERLCSPAARCRDGSTQAERSTRRRRSSPKCPRTEGGGERQGSSRRHDPGMPRRNGPGIALLADQTRRRIVALLALRPRRPSAIAHEVGLSRPATSRQLRLLREAGLVRMVRSRIDGRGYLYSIEPDSHGPITAWLAGTEVGLRGRNHPELDALAGATPMELDAPASSDSHRRSA